MIFTILALIIIIIVGVYLYKRYKREPFNVQEHSDGFVAADPSDPDSYGLRGDLLYRKNINNECDLRHVVLNEGGGILWESDRSPATEGLNDYANVNCPTTDEFDENDICWICKDC